MNNQHDLEPTFSQILYHIESSRLNLHETAELESQRLDEAFSKLTEAKALVKQVLKETQGN